MLEKLQIQKSNLTTTMLTYEISVEQMCDKIYVYLIFE